MADSLRSHFLLDPKVVFLNHGSFGACPRAVFEVYQSWQRELERQPVEFLGRRAAGLLAEARARLADYLHCAADEVVYFPNPTTAINMVARSLELATGDEILATDHEYGAMDRTWRFVCQRVGARYVRQPISLPVTDPQAFVEHFWRGVGRRTRAIFISHITSPTALKFPVEAVCARARAAGILSIVDGAHAPGQVPLDLSALGADVYTGSCHKWLCAPKGSAFLYARREIQPLLQPLVVSWGWEAEKPSASMFVDHHEWQGTRDLAAFLSVPAAIEFQRQHDWETVRARCHSLAVQTRRRIHALTGLQPICPEEGDWFAQMFAALLPPVEVELFQRRLYERYRIEVPVWRWNEQILIRPSFQAYNTQAEADLLIEALEEGLPERGARRPHKVV
ncbi:MAG: aminotransferase class V-fold PLP-dependent enzyme [Chloroflexota bacterium]